MVHVQTTVGEKRSHFLSMYECSTKFWHWFTSQIKKSELHTQIIRHISGCSRFDACFWFVPWKELYAMKLSGAISVYLILLATDFEEQMNLEKLVIQTCMHDLSWWYSGANSRSVTCTSAHIELTHGKISFWFFLKHFRFCRIIWKKRGYSCS